MAKTVCPHCSYDRAERMIVEGAVSASVIGLTALFNKKLGAAALTGTALKAWLDSGAQEVKCPNCGDYYHT